MARYRPGAMTGPHIRLTIPLLVLSLVLAACSSTAGSVVPSAGSVAPSVAPTTSPSTPVPSITTAGTGIAGRATAGPVCPVEKNPPDPACAPRPVAGAAILVTDPSGAEVATATTDDLGAYVVIVPPGDYFVTADPVDGLMGTPEPVPATVGPDALTTVELTYDTGIR
jgi:hypothetical protein